MADYDFNSYAQYDQQGNSGNGAWIFQDPASTTSGTLTDNDAGPNFDIGEPVTTPIGNGSFAGTTNIDGQTWPVVEIGGDRYVFTQTGDPGEFDYPQSIPNNGFNTSDPFPECFAAGTLIRTPTGERPVEDLRMGDLVLTARGDAVPVLWLGRQTVSKTFTPEERFRPIRITAEALGENTPSADLVVTAEHGMMIDGLVVNAGALVNGRSINRVPMHELAEREVYYHIETEAHDVIVANGAAAETFVDNVTREGFDNYSEYEAAYGRGHRSTGELAHPRVMSERQLPEHIRAHLLSRADIVTRDNEAAA